MRTAFAAALLLSPALAAPALAAGPVTLKVFEWDGYISPFADDFAAYAKSKGVDARLAFMTGPDGKPKVVTNADDIFQAARRGEADVVTPTNNYYKDSNAKLIRTLAPIDLALVPNYGQLVDNLRNADFADLEGKKYAVPLLGGGYSLAYNADRVKTPPTSWTALLAPGVKGRTSLTNTQYEANLYVAAILAGTPPAKVYSYGNIDPAKTAAVLEKMVGNAGAFWDANPDDAKMARDLDLITDYGFGVAIANGKGQNWRFAETVEPTTVWLDNMSITQAGAADPEKRKAAHLLLDFMISPPIQARIAALYGVVVPNPKAREAAAPGEQDKVRVGTDAFYKPELLWQPLDERTRNAYKQLWDKAVAAK